MNGNRFDYLATFGIDPARIMRGTILATVLDLELGQIPRFRDAWAERWQNPDRAPGVGPIVIALYTECNGTFRDGMASKIFGIRAHPMYREERDDTLAKNYTTFYMNVPAVIDEEVRVAMIRTAVPPVDTDARWRTALGFSEE